MVLWCLILSLHRPLNKYDWVNRLRHNEQRTLGQRLPFGYPITRR